jgi:hypothetical protein
LGAENYHWEAGEERLTGSPGVITYLIGYPEAASSDGEYAATIMPK